MKLYQKIFVGFLSVVLLIFFSAFVIESCYKSTQNETLLKVICFYSSALNYESNIIEYYPDLIKSENISDSKKDKLLYEYLSASFETNDEKLIIKNLKQAYLEYSTLNYGVGNTAYLITEFYKETSDVQFCLDCYDCLVEISPDIKWKYYMNFKKGEFLAAQVKDEYLLMKYREESVDIDEEYYEYLEANNIEEERYD